MARTSHVPKFGNWDEDDDIPYTQYFETAQVDKSGGKLSNPYDCFENPGAIQDLMYPTVVRSRRSLSESHGSKSEKFKTGEHRNRRRSADVVLDPEMPTNKLDSRKTRDGKATGASPDRAERILNRHKHERSYASKDVRLSSTLEKEFAAAEESKSNRRAPAVQKPRNRSRDDPPAMVGSPPLTYIKVREHRSEASEVPVVLSMTSKPASSHKLVRRNPRPTCLFCFCAGSELMGSS